MWTATGGLKGRKDKFGEPTFSLLQNIWSHSNWNPPPHPAFPPPHLVLLNGARPAAVLVQAPGGEARDFSSGGIVWKYLQVETEHRWDCDSAQPIDITGVTVGVCDEVGGSLYESQQGEEDVSLGCNAIGIVTSLLFRMEMGSSYISSWRHASHGFGPELRKKKTFSCIFFIGHQWQYLLCTGVKLYDIWTLSGL